MTLKFLLWLVQAVTNRERKLERERKRERMRERYERDI